MAGLKSTIHKTQLSIQNFDSQQVFLINHLSVKACLILSTNIPSISKKIEDTLLYSLSGHFSCTDLLEPIDYVENNWSQEPFNSGCSPPDAMTYYKKLSTPFMRQVLTTQNNSSITGSKSTLHVHCISVCSSLFRSSVPF